MEQELEWTVIFGVVSSTLFEGLLLGHVWKEAMLMFQGACKRDEPWTKEWVFMPSLQRLKDSSSSLRSFGEKSSGQKYISWPGRVFFNLVFNYLYVLAGLQMKLQLLPPSLPPPSAHQDRATWGWGARSTPAGTPCWDALGHPGWWKWGVHFWGSLISLGVPTLHVLPLPLCCSSTSPPKPFFPSSPCSLLQGIPGRFAKGPPFFWAAAEGNSTQALHTGPWQSEGGDLEHCLDII